MDVVVAVVGEIASEAMSRKPPKLSKTEIDEAVDRASKPIVSPKELAEFLGLALSTIYEWIQRGRLDGCFRRRGKHVLIWLARAVAVIFNGSEWRTEDAES